VVAIFWSSHRGGRDAASNFVEEIQMAIKGFAHKGLEEVYCTGRSLRIGTEYHKRLTVILDAMEGATCVADLQGARGFHALAGGPSASSMVTRATPSMPISRTIIEG
jgi:hypothetical protein